ncbi:Lysophospholipase L1 [Sphaerochaeta associata]|nr:Lysophospholipase L1 [Sphaerochaeta associata]
MFIPAVLGGLIEPIWYIHAMVLSIVTLYYVFIVLGCANSMSKDIQKIRIFGDSILKGVVYSEEDNRYVPLQQDGFEQLGMTLGIEFQNSAMFGCTITKGMQLLQKAIGKGLDCDSVLLEYGGNDCDFLWDEVSAQPNGEHQPKTPLLAFGQTLKAMIAKLRAIAVEPILMTLPPINSDRYLDHICRGGLDRKRILDWLGDIYNIERYQELYSLRVATVALATQTQLIDIRSGFLARRNCSSLICIDGIHPSAKGHELIMDLLKESHLVRISA